MSLYYRNTHDDSELYCAAEPIRTHGLIIVRDSAGSGGWSLHTQGQLDAAAAASDAPDALLSGDANLVPETATAYSYFDRPDQADYDAANKKDEAA